jgi:hypothetical protein
MCLRLERQADIHRFSRYFPFVATVTDDYPFQAISDASIPSVGSGTRGRRPRG